MSGWMRTLLTALLVAAAAQAGFAHLAPLETPQAVGSATSGTPESLHLVRVQGTVNRTVPVRLQVRADGDLVFDQLLPPQPENVFDVQIPLRNLAATARTVTLAVTGILPGGAANGRDAVARLDETVILPALDVLARGGIEDRDYDDDGNLTSDGTWSYAWNGRNQLAAMDRPGESLSFEYNAEGMRTFKRYVQRDAENLLLTERIHRFVWDGSMLLVEEITETLPDASPQTWHRTYTWGLDLSGSVGGAGGTGGLLSIHDTRLGQTVLPVSNHRGDVIELLSTTGATVADWTFGPFGEPLPASGDPAWLDACRIGFGSKYTDPETGLVYFGFRYYDPRHGRWLGREPLGEEESFNPYAYCHNDPVNRYDFLGLKAIKKEELLGAYLALYGTEGLRLLTAFENGSGNQIELPNMLWTPAKSFGGWGIRGDGGYSWRTIQIDNGLGLGQAAQFLHSELLKSLSKPSVSEHNDAFLDDLKLFEGFLHARMGLACELTASAANGYIAALSTLNEGADWATMISEVADGNYLAAAGVLPFVPAVSGRLIRYADHGVLFKSFKTTDRLIRDGVNLDRFPWGEYLESMAGPAPRWMGDKAHAHHILFKIGNGPKQQELVREGQEILLKYDIDPVFGPENLVWARYKIPEQHALSSLEDVILLLKTADTEIGTRASIVEALKFAGQAAAAR